MKTSLLKNITLAVCSVAVLAGCASTKMTNQQPLVTGPLSKPSQIWVYDFVATPADMPADSTLAGEADVDATPPTAEEIATGRQLGMSIANNLIEQITDMGLPAAKAVPGTTPAVNDLVIRGYLLSIKEGSAIKRVSIGFGAGAAEMKTLVEGFQMTPTGLRKLGSGDVDANGGKSPGAVLGVATFLATKNPAGLIISGGMHVYGEASGSSTIEGRAKATAKEISAVLKKRFQEQGWTN